MKKVMEGRMTSKDLVISKAIIFINSFHRSNTWCIK